MRSNSNAQSLQKQRHPPPSSLPTPICPSRYCVMLSLEVCFSQTEAGAWNYCSKAQIGEDDENRQKENQEPHLPHSSVLSEAKPVPEQRFLCYDNIDPSSEPSLGPHLDVSGCFTSSSCICSLLDKLNSSAKGFLVPSSRLSPARCLVGHSCPREILLLSKGEAAGTRAGRSQPRSLRC